MDYAYLITQGHTRDKASPILVTKDTEDKWVEAAVLPCKGGCLEHNIKAWSLILNAIGLNSRKSCTAVH